MDVFVGARLHNWYEAFELFSVDYTLCLPHEYLVPLIFLTANADRRAVSFTLAE